jgi:hypothetical protein
MQRPKRGNGHRFPKRRTHYKPALSEPEIIRPEGSKPGAVARLTLHDTDPITGTYDQLFTLFYEWYRGYTIYSTEQGRCCIYGAGRQGCLRLWGKFVCFPDIEDAKNLIKYFRARGIHSWESMDRSLPEGDEQVCLLHALQTQPAGCARDSNTIGSTPPVGKSLYSRGG